MATALRQRFFLRFHVSLILLLTCAAGVLTTRGLMWVGVETMWLRYLLAVSVAYGTFLLGVRIWLAYVGVSSVQVPAGNTRRSSARDAKGNGFDLPDLGLARAGGGGGSSGNGGPDVPLRSGGGGDFGGGGATASFDDGGGGLPSSSGGSSSAGASGGGGLGGFDLDGENLVVLLLALLVLLLMLGGAAWLVWAGPEILTEAAFEALLAGGLRKSLRTEPEGWIGKVLRKTWLPFGLVTAAALAFAWFGQSAYPQASTAREVLSMALAGDDATRPADAAAAGRSAADAELAELEKQLVSLRSVDAAAPAPRRAATIEALHARADRLGALGRPDEARADAQRALTLAGPGDTLDMRETAADMQRLFAYRLAENQRTDEALAAYGALRAWLGQPREPSLAWRLVWSLNQAAILQEQQVAEGGGLALLKEATTYPVQAGDPILVREIAEAWRLQGMVALWAAKRAASEGQSSGRPATPNLANAQAAFAEALARLAADAPGRGEALAGMAYARFLIGDLSGSDAALRLVPAQQVAATRELVIDYARHRVLPADAGWAGFVEARLAR